MKKRSLYSVIILAVYIGQYLLSRLWLSDLYLFDWLAKHYYLYLWVISLVLIYFYKYRLAVLLTAGNIVGTFVGQFLGDFLRYKKMQQITPDMDLGQQHQLSLHMGVPLWLLTVILILATGTVAFWVQKQKRKKSLKKFKKSVDKEIAL